MHVLESSQNTIRVCCFFLRGLIFIHIWVFDTQPNTIASLKHTGLFTKPEGILPLVLKSWVRLTVWSLALFLALLNVFAKKTDGLYPATSAVVRPANENGMLVMCSLDGCSCNFGMWFLQDWARSYIIPCQARHWVTLQINRFLIMMWNLYFCSHVQMVHCSFGGDNLQLIW